MGWGWEVLGVEGSSAGVERTAACMDASELSGAESRTPTLLPPQPRSPFKQTGFQLLMLLHSTQMSAPPVPAARSAVPDLPTSLPSSDRVSNLTGWPKKVRSLMVTSRSWPHSAGFGAKSFATLLAGRPCTVVGCRMTSGCNDIDGSFCSKYPLSLESEFTCAS